MLLEIMIKTYKKYYMSTYIIDILPYFSSLKHFGADEPDGRFEVCVHTPQTIFLMINIIQCDSASMNQITTRLEIISLQ